jgi:flagellar biosynthesis/type III secretory pathway chaperone
MENHETPPDFESEVASLLTDLSAAQDELIDVLTIKRDCMASGDLEGMQSLASREDRLVSQLQQCHDRRAALLDQAGKAGRPHGNLRQLAASMPAESRGNLDKQVNTTASRLRMLQHHSLTNWVLAQRSVLHLSQLLEIVATGGRIRPTYDKGESAHPRGTLVDKAV